MKTTLRLFALIATLASAMLLGACGSKPVTLADLPVYEGATELKPGESNLADTLQQNGQQSTAMGQALGAGGSTEQKGFDLPAETTWDQVKTFYTDKLKASGWAEGMSGPGASIANQALSQVNQGNDLFQMTIFSKDKQTLTVMRVADPTDATKVQLILSLSTQ
ncbi:MAG: hypothetical protein HGA65_08260 [Oscillochloris sp.]|nr:hypothetical protein [Oscillochloris sp.]